MHGLLEDPTATLGPFLVAFVVATLLSPAGVSGSFLLLPYQVSVLGLTGPAITPTNHLFNLIAAPAGVARYARDGRLAWPLALVISLSAMPGAVAGALLRMHALADPGRFKILLGAILLAFGARLAWAAWSRRAASLAAPGDGQIRGCRLTPLRLEYEFGGTRHSLSVPVLAGLSLVIGLVGGAVGVGGGSLLAPVLVSAFALPVHSTAGATLTGTFVTSAASIATFALLGTAGNLPDWRLGLAMGLGGLFGAWLGAWLQGRLPGRAIEGLLAVGTLALAASYLVRLCG